MSSIRFHGKPLSDASLRTGLGIDPPADPPARRCGPGRRFRRTHARGWWQRDPTVENVDPITGAELRHGSPADGATARTDLATLLRLWVNRGCARVMCAGCSGQDLDLSAGTALVRGDVETATSRADEDRPRADGVVSPPRGRPDQRLATRGDREAGRWWPASVSSAVRPLDDPGAFVFGRGRVRLSSMDLHRRWRRVLIAAKVRYREPEQLRHTFASTMLSRRTRPCSTLQGQAGGGPPRSCCVCTRGGCPRIRGRARANHPQPAAATSSRRRGRLCPGTEP